MAEGTPRIIPPPPLLPQNQQLSSSQNNSTCGHVSPTLASLLSRLSAQHKHKSGECCDSELHHAAYKGNLKKLQQIVTKKEWKHLLNFRNHLGCTPLRLAVSANRLQCVQELMKHGADPNIPDIKAQTPVMMAVKNNNFQVLRCLLEARADPNGDPNSLYAPILWAAQEGNLPIMRVLLEFGAEVDRLDQVPCNLAKNFPSSPARITLVHHRMDCFKALLLAGAEQNPGNHKNGYQCSMYYVAVSNNCNPEAVELMHEYGLPLWDYAEVEAMVGNKSLRKSPSWLCIRSLFSTPHDLMSFCRIAIRRHLFLNRKLAKLECLPLPQRILLYLQFG